MSGTISSPEVIWISELLTKLKEAAKPHYTNELSINMAFDINFGQGPIKVMALNELVPNPRHGVAPCHFSEPLITFHQDRRDKTLNLNLIRGLPEDLRALIRAERPIIEQETLTLKCFEFTKRR